ncbi:unnamed protein product [Urochloa humidicola]
MAAVEAGRHYFTSGHHAPGCHWSAGGMPEGGEPVGTTKQG